MLGLGPRPGGSGLNSQPTGKKQGCRGLVWRDRGIRSPNVIWKHVLSTALYRFLLLALLFQCTWNSGERIFQRIPMLKC